MSPKIEITLPLEMHSEISTYAKFEGLSINEFIIWAIGEKIGELRERKGLKNLSRLPQTPIIDKVSQPQKSESKPTQNSQEKVKKLLKAEEVAELLNSSKSEAYRLMQTGQLRTVRFGRTVRVREEDLEEFLQRSRT